MEKEVLKTLRYFARFQYAPTFEELSTFVETKATNTQLKQSLQHLVKQGSVLNYQMRYTLGEYSISLEKQAQKTAITTQKKAKAQRFINIMKKFPYVLLIGYSGSVAMENAKEDDDIDLFIITSYNRTWTTRLFALCVAQVLGVRRKRLVNKAPNKVCLNLFFDETDLSLPQKKRTIYGAHEVLQMKPVVNKNHAYERFLVANRWVVKQMPNTAKIYNKLDQINTKNIKKRSQSGGFLMNLVELFAKNIQLWIIKKHKRNEFITDTQLWFFPKDFEKKLM